MRFLFLALLSCMAWGQAISTAPLIVPDCGTEAAKNSVMCSIASPVPLVPNCRIEHFEFARVTIAPQCGTNGWCEDHSLRVVCEPAAGTITLHGDTLPYLKPEPVDVPAIQITVTTDKPDHRLADIANADQFPCPAGQDFELVEGFDSLWECRGVRATGTKWTCADKSRALLTDESGDRHCVKFPKK